MVVVFGAVACINCAIVFPFVVLYYNSIILCFVKCICVHLLLNVCVRALYCCLDPNILGFLLVFVYLCKKSEKNVKKTLDNMQYECILVFVVFSFVLIARQCSLVRLYYYYY